MRKLIEQKLANVKYDLEKIEEQNKKKTSIIRDFREQRVIGRIEAYSDLLNCKELSELESKAEAFDCLKYYGLVVSEDLGNEFIGIKDSFLVGFKLDWVDAETMQEKHQFLCLFCGDTEKDKKHYEIIKKALGDK